MPASHDGEPVSSIVLLSKQDAFSQSAGRIARTALGEGILVLTGQTASAPPEELDRVRPRVILSFLSPWIVPRAALAGAEIALNWHPASVEYPGIGCYNFALYEGASEYGAVCHFMAEKVDSGAIVEERRFPVFANDTVETLKLRTMVTLISMFHDMVCRIALGGRPSANGQAWSRKPFTRRELNELATIDPTMPPDEVRRRVRATTYPGYPGPQVEIGGQKFLFPAPGRKPLA